MANITKSQDISVLDHEAVTHPGVKVGAAISVTTHLAAWVVIYHAYVETTANATPAEFHVQLTPYASGNEGWFTAVRFDTSTTIPPTEALTATEPIGETALAVASTTSFLVGNIVYIQDAGTLANSEWGKLENVVTNTTLDLVDGLTAEKDSSDFAWGEAEIFHAYLDLTAMARLRVYYINRAATGSNSHIKALLVRGDSIG